MKFTLSWLHEFLDSSADIDTLSTTLTAIGLEVDGIEHLSDGLESFTVAEIISTERHPDADKLQVCRVLTHSGERQIVCGAPNARAGIKVILADIGDVIPTNGMKIKPSKIRGVESAGMLCSARELGLGEDHDGIMELPEEAAIGAPIIQVLSLNDIIFDIAITPNRGDCLGVYGIARDLAAAGLGTLKELQIPHVEIDTPSIDVTLQSDACPHFIAYTITGVENKPSPDWLQQRLTSVGLRPISALVDITNYFTIAYGRPLHVYDKSTLSNGITVRDSVESERLEALNEKEYKLKAGHCVIADDNAVLGLGGIIGGTDSSCTDTTQNVVLEAAWFDPVAIAHAGRAYQIDSDARYRFERGVDPMGTEPFAAMAAHMVTSLCGGSITGKTEAGSAPERNHVIAFSPDNVTSLGGLEVQSERCKDILHSLGFKVAPDWHVTVPSWRPDVEGCADLVEEIIRIVGYDTIPDAPLPYHPPFITKTSPDDAVRDALLRRGLDEVVHFAFTSHEHTERFKTDADLVKLANPISVELNTMRTHLYADMLPAIKRNHDRGAADLGMFEIGSVFFGIEPKDQPLRAASMRSGATPMHWQHKPRNYDVFDAKADLFAMLESLGVSTASLMISRDVPDYYHPGKSGRMSLGPKNTLGYFGELHPAISRHFDIATPVIASECWLDAIPTKNKAAQKKALHSLDYQASRRDFAFIVDKDTHAGDLQQMIARADKKLVRDVVLFDVYEGEHIEAGKKSLAFAVTLQADDRTLSEEDINKTYQAIVSAAAKKGATLR